MARPSTPPSSTNRAPTAVTLSNNLITENADAGTDIGFVTVADPNRGDTFSFTVSDDRFEVVSGARGRFILQLADGADIDYETAQSGIPINVTATDSGGLSKTQAFTILVTNVNEAPEGISLSSNTVMENQPGAVVGTLSATDPEGDAVTFSVTDEGFEIVQTEAGESILKLADNESFDYEASDTQSVDINATDGTSVVVHRFHLEILNDPSDEEITGTDGADTLLGTFGNDVIRGLAGNDYILGRAGDDLLDGGPGNDYVAGESGINTIVGGDGEDVLLTGGPLGDSYDTVLGGSDNDHVTVQWNTVEALVYLDGGDDGCNLYQFSGSAQVFGDAGNDSVTIHEGRGGSTVITDLGPGNDRFGIGEAGPVSMTNVVTTGAGEDTVWLWPNLFGQYYFSMLPASPIVITDFTPGVGGDRIDVISDLQLTTRLIQSGDHTVVQVDEDGDGVGAPKSVFLLENTIAGDLTAENFGDYHGPIVFADSTDAVV